MKINVIVAVAVVLIVTGASVAAYSYERLRSQDVLFDQNSILLNDHSYLGYEMPVVLDGKFEPKVIGGVGSVGYGVDFYLVNDTSWNSWSTTPALRSALSTVHLNATAVSSQSIEGQFSFSPSVTTAYSAVFVNDDYPTANNSSVHANITLQYISLNYLFSMVAGLVAAAIGSLLLIVAMHRKIKKKALAIDNDGRGKKSDVGTYYLLDRPG
jgi:hypothetical protein